MKHKFKRGDKVKILWDRTTFYYSLNYNDIGEVYDYGTADDGTPLVRVVNFHKSEEWYNLYFPVYAIHPLREVYEEGDAL